MPKDQQLAWLVFSSVLFLRDSELRTGMQTFGKSPQEAPGNGERKVLGREKVTKGYVKSGLLLWIIGAHFPQGGGPLGGELKFSLASS